MSGMGIMQGRLLPDPEGKVQFFPRGWQDEFALAADLGFSSIEFIADAGSYAEHPLRTCVGREAIAECCHSSGVTSEVLCADLFMEIPPVGDGVSLLKEVMELCARAGFQSVEIPLLGRSSLRDRLDREQVVDGLLETTEAVPQVGLLIECDLPPEPFRKFLDRFGGRVTACYDMGNSTWLGHKPEHEISVLRGAIGNVHVKDCLAGNTYRSVPLGTGDTPLEACFAVLADIAYSGEFILQAARGNDDLEVARRYKTLVMDLLGRQNPRQGRQT